jgi:hypothetical protein
VHPKPNNHFSPDAAKTTFARCKCGSVRAWNFCEEEEVGSFVLSFRASYLMIWNARNLVTTITESQSISERCSFFIVVGVGVPIPGAQ